MHLHLKVKLMKFIYDKKAILEEFWLQYNRYLRDGINANEAIGLALSEAVTRICFQDNDPIVSWITRFWKSFILRSAEELYVQFGDATGYLDNFLVNLLAICDCQMRFFTRGYCYHFAAMLKSVFPKGRILKYRRHMVFCYNGKLYDCTGCIDSHFNQDSNKVIPLKYLGNTLLNIYKRLVPLAKPDTKEYAYYNELDDKVTAHYKEIMERKHERS